MSIEPEHLGWLVKRLQYRHHRALDAQLAALGVTLVQWNALREIARHPEAPQRQLAEHTFNSVQAFGTLAKRLIAAGLVTCRAGTGRATIHELTPQGKALLRKGQPILSAVTRSSFAPLSAKDRSDLAHLLEKVLTERPRARKRR
ncbi:MAG TPA: MarR family winged helix-turn-helix transcriptional regulator [Polyangiaceae bacterium]|jgi:DNA-binding MarR family transcriptional regulator|nr:MarR family winged helix-turn-helix transcriptional regulator [Polyangiaceae bacterium]